ncbi:MAG TPA: hypothetical protein VGM88_20780 [Kofleriaceae bacterium]
MRSFFLIALLAAACGDDGNTTPDGGGHPDTMLPDVPTGDVSITLTQGGTPLAGVTVYFQSTATGAVQTVPTDASGLAHASIADGGMLTVVMTAAQTGEENSDALTYAGLTAGEHIVLALPSQTQTTATVTVPAIANASDYEIWMGCGNGDIDPAGTGETTETGTVDLQGCGDTLDVLVTVDAPSGMQYALARGVSIVGGALDLSDLTYQAQPTVTNTISHLPAGAMDVFGGREWAYPSGNGSYGSYSSGTISGTTANVSVTVPEPDGVVVLAVDDVSLATGYLNTIEWPAGDSYTLDASTGTAPAFSGLPAFANSAVTFAAGSGTADIALTSLELASGAEWTIFTPYTGNSIPVPQLPADAGFATTGTVMVGDTVLANLPGTFADYGPAVFTASISSLIGSMPSGRIDESGASGASSARRASRYLSRVLPGWARHR